MSSSSPNLGEPMEEAERQAHDLTLRRLEGFPYQVLLNFMVDGGGIACRMGDLNHHNCVICGMVPAAAELFSLKLLHLAKCPEGGESVTLPAEDPESTWSPITPAAVQSFHHNLLVLHAYTSCSHDDKVKWRESPFNGPPEGIMFGVVGVKPDTRYKNHLSYTNARIISDDGDHPQTDTSDLESCKASSSISKHLTPQHEIYPRCYPVHCHCWDLLEATAKININRSISFKAFWQRNKYRKDNYEGPMGTYYYHPSLEKFWHVRKGEMCKEDESPYDYDDEEEEGESTDHASSDIKVVGNTTSDPISTIEFQEYFEETVDSGKVSKKEKTKYWSRVNAWMFHSIDGFPVDIANRSDEAVASLPELAIEHQKKKASEKAVLMQGVSFEMLPNEILEKIVENTDLETAMSVALTNSKVQRAVLPAMDCVAYHEMKTVHPWMLPMTTREDREWEMKNGTKMSKYGYSWLHYMKESLSKPCLSMSNRKRVYEHALLICKDIEEHGW